MAQPDDSEARWSCSMQKAQVVCLIHNTWVCLAACILQAVGLLCVCVCGTLCAHARPAAVAGVDPQPHLLLMLLSLAVLRPLSHFLIEIQDDCWLCGGHRMQLC
jgi:hypothetical protein